MGIKDLWQILSPFCERKPLYELEGKKVAIDLSCWVCEAQNVTEYNIQPRMYLRNLYFRTCYLLLMDVTPIFVLEGRAPELKYNTISARNAQQFKGAKPRTNTAPKPGKDRTRFHHTLKLCSEMLKLMGLACIQGEGEAEALCAYLNEDKLVDGIISQDSDCFAYGARTVFRNFSISTQGAHAAKGGSIDVYDLTKAIQNLDFGRNKVIALALLCGSDYSEGVHGVGRDSALKLFSRIGEKDILTRLRSWRTNCEYFEELESGISDKNKCTSCGHSGKVQAHTKKGCLSCRTSTGCSTDYKTERLEIKNELSMRTKALQDSLFPNEELIDEFLHKKTHLNELNLKWTQPDLLSFIKFTAKYLTWEEAYAFEKFLPILTRWQLLHHSSLDDSTRKGTVIPEKIKKIRNPKGVPSYEIIWKDRNNEFQAVIPGGIDEKLFSTIEPQNLVSSAYPQLVQDFEAGRKKPKRKKAAKVDEIGDLLGNISISEPKVKRKKQAKAVAKKAAKVDEIDGLLGNISISEPTVKRKKQVKTIEAFFNSSTPRKVGGDVEFDLDQSKFGDEDDLDVSDAVESVINCKESLNLGAMLGQFGLKLCEEEKAGDCSFFIMEAAENDLFEQTLNNCFSSSGDEGVDEYC